MIDDTESWLLDYLETRKGVLISLENCDGVKAVGVRVPLSPQGRMPGTTMYEIITGLHGELTER